MHIKSGSIDVCVITDGFDGDALNGLDFQEPDETVSDDHFGVFDATIFGISGHKFSLAVG